MSLQHHEIDFSSAVEYHYDAFPPRQLDFERLIGPLTAATSALARYDQMLSSLHNNEVLLAPLTSQEAVVSSRMEGTISTIDEILRIEADQDDTTGDPAKGVLVRGEALEVLSYRVAMRQSQTAMDQGVRIGDFLVRTAHQTLLRWSRGANKNPGSYKTEQNYITGRSRRSVSFIPITPEKLRDGLDSFYAFLDTKEQVPLLKAAISHVEFEALHPFQDGNGRLGRMLVPLLLWQDGAITRPHFYISEYLEDTKDEYIEKMRAVSERGAWTDWCVYFLDCIHQQALRNMDKAAEIQALYEELKDQFREDLSSAHYLNALDYLFTNPVFRNNQFTKKSGIPAQTAQRFSRLLAEKGMLETLEAAAGRRPALYSFKPLLDLVRTV